MFSSGRLFPMFPPSTVSAQGRGYPVPESRPRHGGVSSNTGYISGSIPSGIKNVPVDGTSWANRHFAKFVGDHSSKAGAVWGNCRGKGSGICGSGTLISENEFLTAAHVLDGLTDCAVCIGNKSVDEPGELAKVVGIRRDPVQDLAILTLERPVGKRYGFAGITFDNQPVGTHAVFHHAGGFPEQVSTGDFADLGGLFSHGSGIASPFRLQHHLFIAAGPYASGAGVWNRDGKLIGILVSRSTEYGEISRDIILLSESKLLNPGNMSPIVVPRRIPRFPDSRDLLYSDGLEKFTQEELRAMTKDRAVRLGVRREWEIARDHENVAKKKVLDQTRTALLVPMAVPTSTASFTSKHVAGSVSGSAGRRHAEAVAKTRTWGRRGEDDGVHQSTILEMSTTDARTELERIAAELAPDDLVRRDGGFQVRHGRNFQTQGSYPSLSTTVRTDSRGTDRRTLGDFESKNGPVTVGAHYTATGEFVLNHLDGV